MNPIQIDDILGRERYGTDRDAIRRRLTHYKRARRVSVGPHLTFIFEDRVTVWYQIQEMLCNRWATFNGVNTDSATNGFAL